MMKVDIAKARVRIGGGFKTSGSVLAGTTQSHCTGVTIDLEIESHAPRNTVMHVLKQAENGCYAMQSLRNPTEVVSTITLNGEPVLP